MITLSSNSRIQHKFHWHLDLYFSLAFSPSQALNVCIEWVEAMSHKVFTCQSMQWAQNRAGGHVNEPINPTWNLQLTSHLNITGFQAYRVILYFETANVAIQVNFLFLLLLLVFRIWQIPTHYHYQHPCAQWDVVIEVSHQSETELQNIRKSLMCNLWKRTSKKFLTFVSLRII